MYSSRHHSSPVSGNAVMNAILCVVIVLVVAAILMPMLKVNRRPTISNCYSNLKQIGVAFKTYLSDWDETYPTNRPWVAKGKLGPIGSSVALSKVGTEQDGKPIRFRHGITWVEGLYQYIEPITTQDDHSSVWKCQVPDDSGDAPTSDSAAVSYVFNRNLVEKDASVVRNASTLLLAREVDRLVDSDLRPINDSVTKDQPPLSAFLTDQDQVLGETNPKVHREGSQILFADGHVKFFSGRSFPRNCAWSRDYKTWTNPEGTISVAP